MATLILSYDESIVELANQDFREVIIAFLLRIERNCNPVSPVRSTIIFQSNIPQPADEWTRLLKEEFTDDFFFVIAEIVENGREGRVMRNGNSDIELGISFRRVVDGIQN